ncbi:Leucine-rich repeat-containing protein 15 [Trichoplax sp. H2]|nr:Leucine-rich repeat-containing protein 15 [Trichoplax sp. H2]|eukprot:RDD38153.1 Leucine-rich repeat-containing protein 15 [Trichoplax sp. H2]
MSSVHDECVCSQFLARLSFVIAAMKTPAVIVWIGQYAMVGCLLYIRMLQMLLTTLVHLQFNLCNISSYVENLNSTIQELLFCSYRNIAIYSSHIYRLAPETFERCDNLKTLSFIQNFLKFDEIVDVVTALDSLKGLVIKANKFKDSPVNFRNLFCNQLGSLKIFVYEYERLVDIGIKTFHYLPNLTTLGLSHNRIVQLRPENFANLINLQVLNISHNRIHLILENTFISLKKLRHLNMAVNNVRKIDSDTFYGLENLKYINLKMNHIEQIHNQVLESLPNLLHLIISSNRQIAINFRETKNNSTLRIINLEANSISSMTSETFYGMQNLKFIKMANNRLTVIQSGAFQNLSNLQKIYLNRNFIVKLEDNAFSNLPSLKILLVFLKN